jgi:hypothetical protein
MDESELLELVRRAISLHETTGCLEFVNDKLRNRIQSDPSLQVVGTPEALKKLLVMCWVVERSSAAVRRERNIRIVAGSGFAYWCRLAVIHDHCSLSWT